MRHQPINPPQPSHHVITAGKRGRPAGFVAIASDIFGVRSALRVSLLRGIGINWRWGAEAQCQAARPYR